MSEQTAAGSGYHKEWARIPLQCFFCGRLLLKLKHLTHQPPLTNTLSNLYCSSLILKGMLGKSEGISPMQKSSKILCPSKELQKEWPFLSYMQCDRYTH